MRRTTIANTVLMAQNTTKALDSMNYITGSISLFLMSFIYGRAVSCMRYEISLLRINQSDAMRLTDLPVLDDSPLEALDIQADQSECREDDDSLNSVFLPFIMLRLCSPAQEGRDVFCHLGGGSGGTCDIPLLSYDWQGRQYVLLTIIILYQTVKQNTCHGYSAAREVRIVVHALSNFDPGRGIHVTSQNGEHVVLIIIIQHHFDGQGNIFLTAPPWRAFMIKLKSGGRAPAFPALAASSLGYGGGM
jgi:hypothetical protein